MFFIVCQRLKSLPGRKLRICYTNLALPGILPEVSACDCHPHVQQGLLDDSFFKERCVFDDATWLPGSWPNWCFWDILICFFIQSWSTHHPAMFITMLGNATVCRGPQERFQPSVGRLYLWMKQFFWLRSLPKVYPCCHCFYVSVKVWTDLTLCKGVDSIQKALDAASFHVRAPCLRHPDRIRGCALPYGVDLDPCQQMLPPSWKPFRWKDPTTRFHCYVSRQRFFCHDLQAHPKYIRYVQCINSDLGKCIIVLLPSSKSMIKSCGANILYTPLSHYLGDRCHVSAGLPWKCASWGPQRSELQRWQLARAEERGRRSWT